MKDKLEIIKALQMELDQVSEQYERLKRHHIVVESELMKTLEELKEKKK